MCRLKKTKPIFIGLIFVFVLCTVLLMPAGASAKVGEGQTIQTTSNVTAIGQAANSKNFPNVALSKEQLQEIMTQVLAIQQWMTQQQPQQTPTPQISPMSVFQPR